MSKKHTHQYAASIAKKHSFKGRNLEEFNYVKGYLKAVEETAVAELLIALKVCYASLCTYGSHPIIEKQVNDAIRKAEK